MPFNWDAIPAAIGLFGFHLALFTCGGEDFQVGELTV